MTSANPTLHDFEHSSTQIMLQHTFTHMALPVSHGPDQRPGGGFTQGIVTSGHLLGVLVSQRSADLLAQLIAGP
ncbi:hypothetical protein PG994_014565 [Apiospora phragmitis]|uniref:Uncharacterized protein n=1 Tax=Apiospora phragmitis TaxID=2905665 RepID=A0ABR1T4N6_9PEZI